MLRIRITSLRIRIHLVTLMRIRTRILASTFDADPDTSFHFDANPDLSFHFDADPDPSFQIKAQIEKVLKYAHIPYVLACHLQHDADPDPDYPFDAGLALKNPPKKTHLKKPT